MTPEQFLAFAQALEDFIRSLNNKVTEEEKHYYGPSVLILRGIAMACRAASLEGASQ